MKVRFRAFNFSYINEQQKCKVYIIPRHRVRWEWLMVLRVELKVNSLANKTLYYFLGEYPRMLASIFAKLQGNALQEWFNGFICNANLFAVFPDVSHDKVSERGISWCVIYLNLVLAFSLVFAEKMQLFRIVMYCYCHSFKASFNQSKIYRFTCRYNRWDPYYYWLCPERVDLQTCVTHAEWYQNKDSN